MKQYLLLIAAIAITGCNFRGNNSSTSTKAIEKVAQETPEERAANAWSSLFDNSGFCLFTTGLCSTLGRNRPPIILVFHSYSYSTHHDEGVATLAYWDDSLFDSRSKALYCKSRYKYKFHNESITLYDGEYYARGWQKNPYSRGEDGTLHWDSEIGNIYGQLLEYRKILDINGSEYEYDITPWVNIL